VPAVLAIARTDLVLTAGWDRMLPAWFSRLHPVYRTPVNSIAVVGAASFGFASLSLIGVGQAEAFQLVFNASGIFYALTYVVMFAIPLFGLRGVMPRPPASLRLASLSGPGSGSSYNPRGCFHRRMRRHRAANGARIKSRGRWERGSLR
jgi:amino acid transporter